MYRQFRWQGRGLNMADTVRWLSIRQDKTFEQIYLEKVGTAPWKMIFLGIVVGEIFDGQGYLPTVSAMPERGILQTDVDAFFNEISSPLSALRSRSAEIVKSSQLAYRESPFRGTPLVELQQGSTTVYTCPLKDVLFWRTTSGLYYDVVENERARHIVGSKFEEFERDLIAAKFPVADVRGEVPYGPKGLNKKTPD